MRNIKAFTLIELLVVIAIISILLSIVVPSLRKARGLAQGVVCRSNLKQWGIAFALYTTENGHRFTITYDPAVGWLSYFNWMTMMAPYYDTTDLFMCPSVPLLSSSPTKTFAGTDYTYGKTLESWWYNTTTSSDPVAGSYGMNSWVSSLEPGQEPARGTSKMYWQTMVASAGVSFSNVPLFSDCLWMGGYALDTDRLPLQPDVADDYGNQMVRYAIKRHRNGPNVAFLDGSIVNVDIKELWTLKWHGDFDTGNVMTLATAVWPDWVGK